MFNGDVGSWDTSKVMTMYRTFGGAKAFNSELVWDTSAVTDMYGTFFSANAFNQPGISAWDVSKGMKSMGNMFLRTALESDDCSKQVMHEAWQSVDAFTNAYDWSAAVC